MLGEPDRGADILLGGQESTDRELTTGIGLGQGAVTGDPGKVQSSEAEMGRITGIKAAGPVFQECVGCRCWAEVP